MCRITKNILNLAKNNVMRKKLLIMFCNVTLLVAKLLAYVLPMRVCVKLYNLTSKWH